MLYHKPGIPLAVIEAKANKHEIGKGMQQGIEYARLLDVPFVFATNGDGFIFRDATAAEGECLEKQITLDEFPTPDELWQKYCVWKGYTQAQLPVITQDYYDDGSGKSPRYYQLQAINKTIEAVSNGQNRVLLVMATGTGKTYTAFQIIWRLWKSKNKKRILFLADRNILVDQTKHNDFQPFGTAMTKVSGRTIDPAYEIHLALYQAITGPEEDQKAFKQVAPDFFDLIVIDECHRGSASEDSAWREILDYFSSATQIGLTATPKETHEVSSTDYFGDPVYVYSLKEGIEDGFLAPYKVVRVDIDVDLQGWRPTKGQTDLNGEVIDDRIYNQKDFDRTMVIDERTELVARTITDYLKRTNPMDKTIVFCNDIDHAERMRRALVNLNPEQVKKMQIKALQFLDKQIQESYKHVKTAGYSQILYLYTRSAYRDIPLTDALEAHKYYLGQLETSWTKLSLYEKALTAIAMERYGKTDIAKQIIRSLKEYSTTTPEMGMYWANNRSSLFTNSAIQTHVAIMSAFREIEGNSTDTELMKQWLLRQKQTQSWGSTPTTVDAIYALLLTGNNQLASPEDLSVKLGNKNLNVSPEEATLGYIKQTFTGKEITPKMMNVTLSKKQQQASWGGGYLQYFEKLDKITSYSSDISVKKDLFIQKESNHGNTLTPLAGQNLQVGDRICIRITVTNNQDMQFVHLKDLRAGCFEPTEQLSGKRWQDNISYYQETTDVATNFFFDFLPKGTHIFEYTVWIAQSGTYQDGVATLQCVYAPQYSANSDAGSVTVQ